MNIVTIIEKKRDSKELTTAEINHIIQAITDGSLPDYQTAALLMAIYLNGMTRRETVDLTLAMAHSGDTLDLHDIAPFVVDKHSSGGVGDKTSLVVLPIVSACGVPVGKMSGRGLGSSGGTLDKMESIKGWSSDFTETEFRDQLSQIGLVLAGQSKDLAPADGKLYALRDVTGTVGSIPLIAASIMSKKLAAGADAIVLDVKVGNGAFMPTVESARTLAEIMVNIGKDAGRQTVAILSDMNQPLGHAIGNALELQEALDTLQNNNPPADFWTHCLEIAGHMLHLAGKAPNVETAKSLVSQVRDDGSALAKFHAMITAQGGDLSKPLPQATYITPIPAPATGYVHKIDTGDIGWIAVDLGAGRKQKTDTIDHAVGITLSAKVGHQVEIGETIGLLHSNQADNATTLTRLQNTIHISPAPVRPLPNFYGIIQ